MLHTKMLVLAVAWHWDVGDGAGDVEVVTPVRTWVGSANWTEASKRHLEFGAWSDDKSLSEHAWAFLQDLVRFSEPYESGTVGPEPDLVRAQWDDLAFTEAAEALRETMVDFDDDGAE